MAGTMEGTRWAVAINAEARERWAALDSQHERLVDVSDPLLRELYADPARTDSDRPLQAAS